MLGAMADFSFRLVELPGAGRVLQASGFISQMNAADLGALLAELLPAGQDRLTIDCARVRYMNDTGLDVLARWADELARRGGGLTLVGVSPKNRFVLDHMRYTEKFAEVRAEALVPAEQAPFRLSLSVCSSGQPRAILLEAVGELDDGTLPDELAPLARCCEHELRPDLVIDGARLRSARGVGLSLLAAHARGLATRGGSLALLGLPAEVRAEVEASGLEQSFSVVCSERPASRLPVSAR
jgi:anti-anti-sigma regulatory factor